MQYIICKYLLNYIFNFVINSCFEDANQAAMARYMFTFKPKIEENKV